MVNYREQGKRDEYPISLNDIQRKEANWKVAMVFKSGRGYAVNEY